MQNITIVGNVGSVDMREFDGDPILDVRVAVNSKLKGEDICTWYSCTIWGKRAETLGQYIEKGSKLAVSGDLTVREYTTKDGDPGFSLDIRVNTVTFCGGNGDKDDRGGRDRDRGERGGRRERERDDRSGRDRGRGSERRERRWGGRD